MKLIINMVVLALLLYSCDCADDNRTDYGPAAISGSWKLSQKISEGEITVYNENHYKHLQFNPDYTYSSKETIAGEIHTKTGSYKLTGNQLIMIPNNIDTIVATVAHLGTTTLALQLEHDHDNDGDPESVRESYTAQ